MIYEMYHPMDADGVELDSVAVSIFEHEAACECASTEHADEATARAAYPELNWLEPGDDERGRLVVAVA